VGWLISLLYPERSDPW